VFERGWRSVREASSKSEALMREIAGQGPQKTLRRGFAVVRTPAGQTVTASREVAEGAVIEVSVRDGVIEAVVRGTRDADADDEA
jgi:exodeoxyribonuclease VII large subunit